MKKRILIIGCGSIGIRHLRMLKLLKVDKVYALRSRNGHFKQLPDDIKTMVCELPDQRAAKELKPTHIIISNPTSLHLKTVLTFIDLGAKMFIEKPLAAYMTEINRMGPNQKKKFLNSDSVVGFHLRFHDVFKKIKKIVEKNELGRPLRASLSVGHYLPHWHPYEDYTKGYAARSDLGGGVLRTLSHELDMICFLFGSVESIFAKVEKLSDLKIDVDDCVDVVASLDKCPRVHVCLDYLLPELKRKGEILFEKGLLEYDYFKGEIYKTTYRSKKRVLFFKVSKDHTYDLQYKAQMREFLSQKQTVACSVNQGIENLRIIEACEKSQKNKEASVFSLKSKVAVVFGGNGHLGKQFCKSLLKQGARVYSCDIKAGSCAQTRALKKKYSSRFEMIEVNATDPKDLAACKKYIVKKSKKVDILVNATTMKGDDFYLPFEKVSLEGWDICLKGDLTVPFLTTQAFVPVMKKLKTSSIINIASIYGIVGNDQRMYEGSNLHEVYVKKGAPKIKQVYAHGVYTATKGGLINFTKYLAAYYGANNVRVNCISPGGIYHKGENKTFLKKYSEKTPLGRKADLDEMDGALIFLASDASTYVTGHNLVVDGGFTIW